MVDAIRKGSWRTTLSGVLTIVGALCAAGLALLDGNDQTNVDVPLLITALTAGVGLLSARDNKVTSAAAGAE